MGTEEKGAPAQAWQQQVLELTRMSQEQRDPPLLWAIEVGKCLQGAGVMMPSVELAQVLVSHLCWSNNGSMLWKYIEQAMGSHLVPSLVVLALLTSRVIPYRQSQPEAYRLYLELLRRYAFSFASEFVSSCQEKVIKAVDDALQLSQSFGTPVTELGQVVVLFVFTVVSNLTDATAEDWSLQIGWSEKQRRLGGNAGPHDMETEIEDDINDKRHEHREDLRRTNTVMAMEVFGKLLENKRTSTLLRLARRNMPEQWSGMVQRLQILEVHSSSSNSKATNELFAQLIGCIQRGLSQEYQPSKHQAIRALVDAGSCTSLCGHNYGVGRADSWLPFDLFLESTMEGKQLPATSTVEILAEMTKSLQAVNGASWHETFLGLWTAALRLVQRERDPVEGPIPHLDARLCMLLSVTPLVVAYVIEEEGRVIQSARNGASGSRATSNGHDKESKMLGIRTAALVSSLQILGQFDGLLGPPQSVVSAANQAAAKAASFVSSLNGVSGSFEALANKDNANKAAGNMWHLIVEACIARRLIDSSAYLWPGYVGLLVNPLSHSTPIQVSPWNALMEGAPLSISLKNALIATPASSLAELEKIYQIAINGPEDERSAAASILCGASLIRGWNVQEHAVRLVVKLLSPPPPPDYRGSGSHLVACAPLLYAVLVGVTNIDTVHVLSLYGMIPEVAAALMPICEIFGSISPAVPSSAGEDISVYMVFSCAFLLLLRLWKFYRPPHEHCLLGRGAPIGSELTLEYLLFLRNIQAASSATMTLDKSTKDNEQYHVKRMPALGISLPQTSTPAKVQTLGVPSSFVQPVFIESFPKLKAWYCQHQACIASTLSGLVRGNPMHQIADRLLTMMFRKMSKGGTGPATPGASASSSVSSSSGNAGDDASLRPLLPAWDILGAVPFVVDAVLTACAHGRLSPRDLTTGLRDLVDFLPASLAAIVSYFSAEVTRGVWKPASMNGTDWPSPAANLSSVEAEIKEILAATGVHVPSLVTVGGNAPATLPLPLAALVSLTITFKLDKSSEFLHGVAGPALENTAAGSPWPGMPIVAALWCQKVRRWHDFIVFSSSGTVFKQDKHAVIQLLRSCFAAVIGSSNTLMSKLTVHGGVGALLGHGFCSRSASGGMSPVAPGILYLRTYRAIYDIMFVTEEILSLVVGVARDFAAAGMKSEYFGHTFKTVHRLKSHQLSLATAIAKIKQASALGASLLCISGGSGLVQRLYQETLPTWFLSGNGSKSKSRASCPILEGYAISHFSILCGACAWGINSWSLRKRKARVLGSHMDFLASALDGKISLGCEDETWKAYVLSFLAMVITCTPNWISDVKLETLRRLAAGLRRWHEPELALALLERGGPTAMSAAAEVVMSH